MSFLLVSRGSRVDFKKWRSLHQHDFFFFFISKKEKLKKKRDSNPGGFGNAELRLCQPNVSRDVKVHRGGRSGEVAPLLPSRNTESAAAAAAHAAHAAATAETRASIGKH